MLPWKLFFRAFSALVLMATGGFAAGHDLPLPFTTAPTGVAAPPAAPVADASTTTTTAPAADPAPPVVDVSTTTTTAPEPPVVAVPVPDPAPVTPPAVPAPTKPAKPLKPTTTPPTTAPVTPPAVPVDGAAPSVCAAAATAVCGPADPAPSADDSVAARVKRCQDWWNSLADAFDHNGRPEWATKAREIAGRCEAMIAQWQQMEQRWEEHNKGDHNGDGHSDNGGHQSPPPAQPRAQPNKQISRHGEGRH